MNNLPYTKNRWSQLDKFLLAKIDENRKGKSRLKKNKILSTKEVSSKNHFHPSKYFFKYFF
jgi:hypothetical protein